MTSDSVGRNFAKCISSHRQKTDCGELTLLENDVVELLPTCFGKERGFCLVRFESKEGLFPIDKLDPIIQPKDDEVDEPYPTLLDPIIIPSEIPIPLPAPPATPIPLNLAVLVPPTDLQFPITPLIKSSTILNLPMTDQSLEHQTTLAQTKVDNLQSPAEILSRLVALGAKPVSPIFKQELEGCIKPKHTPEEAKSENKIQTSDVSMPMPPPPPPLPPIIPIESCPAVGDISKQCNTEADEGYEGEESNGTIIKKSSFLAELQRKITDKSMNHDIEQKIISSSLKEKNPLLLDSELQQSLEKQKAKEDSSHAAVDIDAKLKASKPHDDDKQIPNFGIHNLRKTANNKNPTPKNGDAENATQKTTTILRASAKPIIPYRKDMDNIDKDLKAKLLKRRDSMSLHEISTARVPLHDKTNSIVEQKPPTLYEDNKIHIENIICNTEKATSTNFVEVYQTCTLIDEPCKAQGANEKLKIPVKLTEEATSSTVLQDFAPTPPPLPDNACQSTKMSPTRPKPLAPAALSSSRNSDGDARSDLMAQIRGKVVLRSISEEERNSGFRGDTTVEQKFKKCDLLNNALASMRYKIADSESSDENEEDDEVQEEADWN